MTLVLLSLNIHEGKVLTQIIKSWLNLINNNCPMTSSINSLNLSSILKTEYKHSKINCLSTAQKSHRQNKWVKLNIWKMRRQKTGLHVHRYKGLGWSAVCIIHTQIKKSPFSWKDLHRPKKKKWGGISNLSEKERKERKDLITKKIHDLFFFLDIKKF
jgi:hypothetical protein